MIKALAGGFGEIIKRPSLLIPAFVGMALNIALLLFAIDNYFNFFFNVLILGQVPDAPLLDLPFYIASAYLPDIFVMSVAVFASLFISIYILYTYCALVAKGEKSAIKALLGQFSRVTEIFSLSFFSFVGFFLYATAAFFLFLGAVSLEGTGIIFVLLLLLWIGFGTFSFLKFLFSPLFMAINKKKMKAAMAQSWQWSTKRIIEIALFLLLIGAITGIINAFFSAAADATGFDAIAIAALVIGFSLSNAYYNIALIKYFENSS